VLVDGAVVGRDEPFTASPKPIVSDDERVVAVDDEPGAMLPGRLLPRHRSGRAPRRRLPPL
jgi:hypothetical protein